MTSYWIIYDPNWGEPVPLLTTLSETEEEAWNKACLTDERGAQIYSGAALFTVPPTPGLTIYLTGHGYFAEEVFLSDQDLVAENKRWHETYGDIDLTLSDISDQTAMGLAIALERMKK